MNQFKFSLLVVLIILSRVSIASELSYACEVKHVYSLSDNGSIKTSSFEKTLKGSIFSVSRVNGEIIGKPIPTILASSTNVINGGSKDYSFKTIALFDSVNKPLSKGNETSKYTGNAQLLEIKEFKETKNKPFIAMSMSGVGLVTGICK